MGSVSGVCLDPGGGGGKPVSFFAPQHVIFSQIEGEAVLLNLKTERYFGMDEIGTRMWRTLAETGTISQTCEILQARYSVEAENLSNDLETWVQKLVRHGLLEVVAEEV